MFVHMSREVLERMGNYLDDHRCLFVHALCTSATTYQAHAPLCRYTAELYELFVDFQTDLLIEQQRDEALAAEIDDMLRSPSLSSS